MVGSNMLKDNGLKDGATKGRPGQAPPPKSRPAPLRVVGVLGGWIAVPFKAVWRMAAAAIGAAAGLTRGLAGFTRGLMHREAMATLAAVVAAAAAVFAWSQSVDTETRQISSELLNRFNSDEMWKARLTLERYYYLLSGDKITPADLARLTEEYFKSLVYQRILKGRFHRNTGDYLECFWLPVELGQNAALYQGRKPDTDKRACQVVDWYRRKFPVAGRPITPCVAYATRQPDFCVDPKAEALL